MEPHALPLRAASPPGQALGSRGEAYGSVFQTWLSQPRALGLAEASETWKEEETTRECVWGCPRGPPRETFINERTFRKFFKAISSYPGIMRNSKTQGSLMDPR